MTYNMRNLIKIIESAVESSSNDPNKSDNSSVSDKYNGHDLEAYHGTTADFNAFKLGGEHGRARESNIGFWFTDNPDAASDFAAAAGPENGNNIMPVRLRLKNPLIANGYDEVMDLVDEFTTFARVGFRVPNHTMYGRMRNRQQRSGLDKVDYKGLVQKLKGWGYDGIVIKDTLVDSPDGVTPIDQYIVFDANQIRSKFAKFDPKKKDSDIITDSREDHGTKSNL